MLDEEAKATGEEGGCAFQWRNPLVWEGGGTHWLLYLRLLTQFGFRSLGSSQKYLLPIPPLLRVSIPPGPKSSRWGREGAMASPR